MSLLTPLTVQINPPTLVPSVVSPPEPTTPDYVALIESGTITNQAEYVITDLLSDYIKYVLYFSATFTVGSASTDFVACTSTDNGSTFTTSADSYGYRVQRSSGSSSSNTTHWTGTWTRAELSSGISNISGNFMAGSIEIYDPMDSGVRTTILTHSGGNINADGNTADQAFLDVTGQREVAEGNDAVRIFVNSGNYTMKYALYGYK